MIQNFINTELTDADLAVIKDNLHEISAKLPFLIGLKVGDKRKKLKLGDKSWSFITDVYTHVNLRPSLCPPDMSLDDFKKDYALLIKMMQIQAVINVLASGINDTVFQLEAECIDSSLEFYNSIQRAAKRNDPEAAVMYEILKKYFVKKPRVKKSTKKKIKSV